MTVDIEKLKALALAATPGPWDWEEDGSRLNGDNGKEAVFWPGNVPGGIDARSEGWGAALGQTKSDAQASADAEFIAATDPATVLELIAEVERLRADAERLDWILANRHLRAQGNDENGWCVLDCSDGLTFVVKDAATAREAIDAAIEKEKA
jgi:hypothetical protein